MDLYAVMIASAVIFLGVQYLHPKFRYGRMSGWTWMIGASSILAIRFLMGDTPASMVLMASIALVSLGICGYFDWRGRQNREVSGKMYQVMWVSAGAGGLVALALFLAGRLQM